MTTAIPRRAGGSWEDRLEPLLSYTSPQGTLVTAYYVDGSEEVEARGSAWEFPGVDGAFVQRTGAGARVYDITFIFSGADHDQRAAVCVNALLEPGFGKLQTPLYGKKTVAPLGKIKRTNDFVNGLNESRVEVSLLETLESLYPGSVTDAGQAVRVALDAYNVQGATSYQRRLRVDTKQREIRAQNTFIALIQKTRKGLSTLSRTTSQERADMLRQINLVTSTVNAGLDTPLVLAGQVQDMFQLPARVFTNLKGKVAQYSRLVKLVTDSDEASGSVSLIPEESKNNLACSALMAQSALSASALSTANTEYQNRSDALQAALGLLESSDELRDWRETRSDELDVQDDAENHAALQNLLDAAAYLLIESSFLLSTEIEITLTTDRGLLELCAELYGNVESDTIDAFISSNRFTNSEILEIPKGRKVVYFA